MDRPEPLVSTLADDPALRPAVARFAAGLPARLQAIASCLTAGDAAQAAELAHKLAGAAGMHGFMPIADAARRVEADLRRPGASTLAETLRALRFVCERAHAV
jgi:HPt (histidine-containing phosphotransfer) domain-containing protein